MANNPPLDVVKELGFLLSGEGMETLLDELTDPGSQLSVGQAAKFFGAMEAVGAKGMEGIKDHLAGVRLHTDEEVLFKWRNPSTQMRVDTDKVKKLFPQAEYPDLYKQTEVKGGTTVELPFDKNNLALPMQSAAQGQPEPFI